MAPQSPGDRIKVLVEELGLSSISEFCRVTGIHRGTLQQITDGKTVGSFRQYARTKEAFPEVNLNWLISSELPILLTPLQSKEESTLLEMYRNHITGEETPEVTVTFQTEFTRPAAGKSRDGVSP